MVAHACHPKKCFWRFLKNNKKQVKNYNNFTSVLLNGFKIRTFISKNLFRKHFHFCLQISFFISNSLMLVFAL